VTQAVNDALDTWSVTARVRERRNDRTSYSQFGEDKVLRSLLPIRCGRYVDIGAGDPRRNSNSYYFYRRGWRGVLVEANPEVVHDLKKYRRRDKVVNAVVSAANESGSKKIWIFDTSELSTADESRAQNLQAEGHKLSSVLELPQITISNLISGIDGEFVDLLTIDIEGLDYEVLSSNDWTKFRPSVVCVETQVTTSSDIQSLLLSVGYQFVAQQGMSAIFADNEVPEDGRK
jgi:FkbM family methyltransferase